MAAYLSPLDQGKKIVLEKAIVFVGRHPECDVLLTQSKKISRKHCCIAQVNDAVIIRDLGSMNGIQVNGKRVEKEQRLTLGDEVTIGDCRFVLKAAAKRDESPSAAHGSAPPSAKKSLENGSRRTPQPAVPSAANGDLDFPLPVSNRSASKKKQAPSKTVDEPLTPEAIPLLNPRPQRDDIDDLEFFEDDVELDQLNEVRKDSAAVQDDEIDELEAIGLDDDAPSSPRKPREPKLDDLEFIDFDDDNVMTLDENDEFKDSGSQVELIPE